MDFRPLGGCFITAVLFVLILCGIGIYRDYSKHKTIKNYESEFVYKDSIYNKTIDSLNNEIKYDEEIILNYKNQIDSYEIIVDSLNEELDVAKIKLDRIKEYNRIAGQGNNITFLRGWINRVLND